VRNALTIDVEDWFTSSLALFNAPLSAYGQCPTESVVTNTRLVLDLLGEYGHKATFFVLGTVVEYYPELAREIYQRGHEIATHGYSHRLVYQMKTIEFKADLEKAIEITKSAIGDRQFEISGYRAPYFSLTRQSSSVFDFLIDKGIHYDSSIFPIRRKLYGDPDAPISLYAVYTRKEQRLWEFPPSTVRLLGQNLPIAGGGYLRLFPYFLIQWGIKRLNRAGQPAIIYVHPYELDPSDVSNRGNDGIAVGRLTRFTQSFGRKVMEKKLRRLLDDFDFGSIREVFQV